MSSGLIANGSADRRRFHLWACAGAAIAIFACAFGFSASRAEAITCSGSGQVGTDGPDYVYGDPGPNIQFGLGGDDRLDGNAGVDCIGGFGGDDVLFGGPGDPNDPASGDLLAGGTESDHLYGGEGNDELHGDAGDDFLYGGTGVDTLDGGDGTDVCYGQHDPKSDRDYDQYIGCEFVVSDAEVSASNDQIPVAPAKGCDVSAYLQGGTADNNMLFGDPGGPRVDLIFALEGNDTVRGYQLHDCLAGNSQADWIDGGPANDLITGDAGSDTLYGGDGDDVIYGANSEGDESNDQDCKCNIDLIDGGAGNDWINGGPGTDEIYGGPGYDVCRGGVDSGKDKFHGCEVVKQG